MPTLTQLSNFKRLAWIPAVILVFIILVGLIYYRYSKPPQTPTTSFPPVSFDVLPAITSTFNTQNLVAVDTYPQTVPIYRIENQRELTQIAQTIATYFGFEQKPTELTDATSGNGLAYTSNDAALVVYENTFTYQKYLKNTPTGTFEIQPLINQTAATLHQLGLPTPTDEPEISYSKLTSESITSASGQDANFINLTFRPILSTLPVESSTSKTESVFDGQGHLVRLSYNQVDTQSGDNVSVISYKDALSVLSSKKGSLISMQASDENLLTDKIAQANITTAYLAYYLPESKPQILTPVWIFKGEAEISGEKTRVTYAVDAIKR
ncbi:MAG TPA: hypothetical protein VLE91_01150 [Candidatus Saccharimonadales bacterium]|nr:hypothetical protein [Candidatus Saccharimonadales bacterium]